MNLDPDDRPKRTKLQVAFEVVIMTAAVAFSLYIFVYCAYLDQY